MACFLNVIRCKCGFHIKKNDLEQSLFEQGIFCQSLMWDFRCLQRVANVNATTHCLAAFSLWFLYMCHLKEENFFKKNKTNKTKKKVHTQESISPTFKYDIWTFFREVLAWVLAVSDFSHSLVVFFVCLFLSQFVSGFAYVHWQLNVYAHVQ